MCLQHFKCQLFDHVWSLSWKSLSRWKPDTADRGLSGPPRRRDHSEHRMLVKCLLDFLNLKWNFYHPNAKWRFVSQFKPSRMGVTLADVDKEVRSNPLRFGLSTTAWLTSTACGLDLSPPQNLDFCKFYAILEIHKVVLACSSQLKSHWTTVACVFLA